MKHCLTLFVLLFQAIASQVIGEVNIYLYAPEISDIRFVATQAVLESHRKGGKLFRTSFVDTPEGFAYETFKWRVSYTHYSEAFNKFLSYCHPDGIDPLYDGYVKVTDLFYNFYTECIAKHQSLQAHYERGKIYFDRGIYEECLDDIQPIVEAGGGWNLPNSTESQKKEFLLTQGQTLVETGAYDKAIETLSDLIQKDPRNKEAYYNRALAYFETGAFDQAMKDYITSGKKKSLAKIESKVSNEFRDALLSSLAKGGMEAAIDFVPSLCHTVYGLGTSLWSLAQHPVDSTKNFCNACQEMGVTAAEYFKTLDREKLEGYADEIMQLCERFDHLSDGEKGHLIGYSIGRYGIDIFAGGAALKGVAVFKKLKDANRLCNLEAMALSVADKEAIIASGLRHEAERQAFFKNVKIHWDRQNKHVPGKHNYIEGRSIFLHNHPQKLLNNFAGTGIPLGDRIPGGLDYRELVNFKEFIGYHIDVKTKIKTPTNWGEIRYSNDGVHIIPAYPR